LTEYKDPTFPGLFKTTDSDPKKIPDLLKRLLQILEEWQQNLKSILDGGLSFEDNMDVSLVTVTSDATPGTEFSVSHGLGKVPTGYIVYKQGGAGTIYNGPTANTATTLYLRSDASSTSFSVIVF